MADRLEQWKHNDDLNLISGPQFKEARSERAEASTSLRLDAEFEVDGAFGCPAVWRKELVG